MTTHNLIKKLAVTLFIIFPMICLAQKKELLIIGTMHTVPNIVKKPIIWLPAIVSSAVLGPIASAVFKMVSNPVGSGMGSAGFVGQISAYTSMVEAGTKSSTALILILLMHFVLPAIVTLLVSEFMRKKNWIKNGDMKLNI